MAKEYLLTYSLLNQYNLVDVSVIYNVQHTDIEEWLDIGLGVSLCLLK